MSARTPQMVRLEVALAKARYYDATTLEEEIASHARLVEVETELRDMDGGGCEHPDARDADGWSAADEDGYDVEPNPDRYDR